MTLAVGGSWDGRDWPGYPFKKRVLVLFTRKPDGSSDFDRPETYIRKEPGDKWFFAHKGPKREEDGEWNFP